jgi:hypothetical protein
VFVAITGVRHERGTPVLADAKLPALLGFPTRLTVMV